MELKNPGGANSNAINYRPDVDGLRAVAVLSVVLYHFSHTVLPGGYLGVDVFFVISGYLITSIIWKEIQDNEFSIAAFYERRVRRIMPALSLMLLASTIAATMVMLPADLVGFGKSLLATLAFVANIYFWRDTDYFSRAAEEKPLLHLWSLGVEEQFYILFPLVLIILFRFWRRGVMPVVAIFTLGSLALNIIALQLGGGSPAFFLLPTRAWELGFGALLAVLPASSYPGKLFSNILAIIGGGLLVISLGYAPSFFAIPKAFPAVFGASLLIFSGQRTLPTASRYLAFRPVVLTGLVSYSLYLWHWPVIVFGQYYLVRPFNVQESLIALAAMVVLAIFSWRFIERPFRNKAMSILSVRNAALGSGLVLAVCSAVLIVTAGLPSRLDARAAIINSAVGTNYRCPVADYIAVGTSRACLMHLPSGKAQDADVVLLGNSHAQMYAPLWETILVEKGLQGLLLPINACLPTTQANISTDCIAHANRNLAEVMSLPKARTVIIGLTWNHASNGLIDSSGHILDNENNLALVTALDALIAQLQSAGKRVVLIGPIAEPGWDVASTVSRQLAFGHALDRETFTPKTEFTARFGTAIDHFSARKDIAFPRPDQIQCPTDRCDYLLDGRSLFSDSNHVAVQELHRFYQPFSTSLAVH